MLHEILISLSGHPSPLLSSSAFKDEPRDGSGEAFPLLSPPERALLASLAHLSEVHQQLIRHTSLISSTHRSTICRAVSSAIVSTHLASFQRKILEIERGILTKDTGRDGGYDIVPLTSVVGEFDEWTRRMEWFWDIAQFMLPIERDRKNGGAEKGCTGATIIDKLRKEAQTGYPDIGAVASDLTKVAETAWLRQLSTWVLYGRLPAFGAEDFFIEKSLGNAEASHIPTFDINTALIPSFVTPQTMSSILFIGQSLNHLHVRSSGFSNTNSISSTSSDLSLIPIHLRHLSALNSPIASSSLSSAIAAIRLSLSRNSLQQLLPLPKIIEILEILGEFFLLERGEFAVALITEADAHIKSRHRLQDRLPISKLGSLGNVVVKEGEVTAVLARTWAALALSQAEEDLADEKLDLARDLVYLSLSKSSKPLSYGHPSSLDNPRAISLGTTFNDLLFSTPTTLSINIPSPLDLFLTASDLSYYSSIHAYLLSIRRAHLRLTDLWKQTSLRREQSSTSTFRHDRHKREETYQKRRQRANQRTRAMRKIWATSSAAGFLLAELGSYLQGEVVRGSWTTFRTWLQGEQPRRRNSPATSRPSSSTTTTTTKLQATHCKNDHADVNTRATATTSLNSKTHKPSSSSSSPPSSTILHDPETITHAHKAYLTCLSYSLLLTSVPFTQTLRSALAHLDHFIALITRLQSIQQALDLETDVGVVDTFAHNARDEKEVWRDLEAARREVESDVWALVERLKDIDEGKEEEEEEREWDGRKEHVVGGGGGFVPWRGGGVDRLLMKLDFGSWGARGGGGGGGGSVGGGEDEGEKKEEEEGFRDEE